MNVAIEDIIRHDWREPIREFVLPPERPPRNPLSELSLSRNATPSPRDGYPTHSLPGIELQKTKF